MLFGAISLFLGTANPIIHIPLLAIFYPAALYLIGLHACSGKQAFFFGFGTGVIGASACLYWLVVPLREYAFFPWILALPVPVCVGVYFGLYAGTFSYLMYKAKSKTPIFRIIFVFFAWFFLEWFRSWFLTGLTWLNLASANAAFPVLVQGASIVGMTGLSALFACIGCSFFNRNMKVQILGLMILLGLVGYGYYRIEQPIEAGKYEYYLVVQGNVDQSEKWVPEMQGVTLDKYLRLAQDGVNRGHVLERSIDVIVFPETSMPFYIQEEYDYRERLFQFAHRNDVVMLVGGVTYTFPESSLSQAGQMPNIYNSLYVIDKQRNLEALPYDISNPYLYSKQHLLPFGEYLPPVLDWEIFAPLLQGFGGFTPQEAQNPLMYRNKAILGALICYESTFSDLAQEQVANGAQVLINVSNDAWYGYTSAASQHLDITTLRAIEQNRYLVRSTNTGISAFINPYGQIYASTGLFIESTRMAAVGYLSDKTIYHYINPFFSYIMNLLFLIFLYILFMKKRSEPKK